MPIPVPVPYSLGSVVPMATYMMLEEDGAMAMCACTKSFDKPFDNFFQVFPPSIDLKISPLVPAHSPFSHGPSRDSQSVAKMISGFAGSMATSSPPVFSSM